MACDLRARDVPGVLPQPERALELRRRRLRVVRPQRERAELVPGPALGDRVADGGRGRGQPLEDLEQRQPARHEREERDERARESQLVVEPALAVGAVDEVEQPADLLL